MGDSYVENHFIKEKRHRYFLTLFNLCGIQLLGYTHIVNKEVAMTLCFFVFTYLVANYFSTLRFDAHKHWVNLTFSTAACCCLIFSPSEINFARLMSFLNALSIGFEQKTYPIRIFYTVMGIIPWIVVTKTYKSFQIEDECLARKFEEDTNIFIFSFVLIMLISAFHSDMESKALKSAADSLSQLKDINAKYEQANRDLKQLLEEKDNFIFLFSHETRNPLNILMGNLSILLNEIQTPRIRARIIRAKFCAELLLHNLNNILDTGKLINRGNLEVAPVTVNLSQYLHSIWDIVKMMAMKKQLKPLLVIPQQLPTFVIFDSQKVSQIIINLVSNSAKFTNSGSISLTAHYLNKNEIDEDDFLPSSAFGNKLAWTTQEKDTHIHDYRAYRDSLINSRIDIDERVIVNGGNTQRCYTQELMRDFKARSPQKTSDSLGGTGFLKIEIIDTGRGVSEEDAKQLFQKFSQVNSDASQRQLGSGLGLWISKTLSELLGGSIRMYSKPDVGTAVVFIIRADSSRSPPEKPHISQSLTLDRIPSTQRILLVDDDPYNLETHFQLLKSLGFTQIDTAADGVALVNALKSKPEDYYELIITDINMPHLNGIDAVRAIRQYEKSAGRSHPASIGFITGHSNNKEKQICEGDEIRGAFYLSKPVALSTLEGALQTLGISTRRKHFGGRREFITADRVKIENTSKRKPRVLCVDDDILNLEIFEDLIADLGAEPLRATSGKEAIDIFRSKQGIDLVLIDCLMPGIDGWTACAEMKKIAAGVPVIGVTGDHAKRHAKKFEASKMDEVIRKPVQREELGTLLIRYLQN